MDKQDRILIGRSDVLDLPELDLQGIEAKVDTGARTSAINCHDVEEVEIDGVKKIFFYILDPEHPQFNEKRLSTKNYSKRIVKNSFGDSEERYVIKTIVEFFGSQFETEFTLSNRNNLKFPILLGRRLLAKRFVVDVAKKNVWLKQQELEQKK
jgi:hypothetical protein